MSRQVRLLRDEDAPEYDGDQRGPRIRVVDEAPRFAMLWESVLFDPELSSNAKVVYAVLQRMAHGKPEVQASHTEIARLAGLTRNTVSACLANLVERGHIQRRAGGFSEAQQIVLVPPAATDHVPNIPADDAQKTSTHLPKNCADDDKNLGNYIRKDKRDNEREGERVPNRPQYSASFEAWWRLYPRGHGNKAKSYQRWRALRLDDDAELREAVTAGLARWVASRHWRDGYVKYAETWLKDRYWEDDPPPDRSRNGRVSQASVNAGGTGRVVL